MRKRTLARPTKNASKGAGKGKRDIITVPPKMDGAILGPSGDLVLIPRPRVVDHITYLKKPLQLRVFCVGDTHFPFVDNRRLDIVIEEIRKYVPDAIVQMGDLFDLFHFYKDNKSSSWMTPEEEVYGARREAEKFWVRAQDAAPKARCYQLLGNHDARMLHDVVRKAPEVEAVLNISDFFQLWQFPGVETQPNERTELELDGVVYHHGYKTQAGAMAKYYMQRCVTGHTHRGSVSFVRCRDITIWQLDCGFIADENSPAMAYTAMARTQSVPGYGIVDEYGPRFVPL